MRGSSSTDMVNFILSLASSRRIHGEGVCCPAKSFNCLAAGWVFSAARGEACNVNVFSACIEALLSLTSKMPSSPCLLFAKPLPDKLRCRVQSISFAIFEYLHECQALSTLRHLLREHVGKLHTPGESLLLFSTPITRQYVPQL
jgi:hypothetical protein